MTYAERNAWFEIAVAGTTIAAYVALLFFLGPEPAIAAFAILALTSLSPMRRGRRRETLVDERDVAILQRSSLIGYGVFWVAFVAGTMGVWVIRGEDGSIPANALPLFPMTGCLVLMLSRSLATVVQYARSR